MRGAYLADVKQLSEMLMGERAEQTHRKFQAMVNPKGGTGFTAGGIITPDFYEQEFGIQSSPRITDEQEKALKEFGFRILFFPAIDEADYPKSFVKPKWGQYLTASEIVRYPLPGRFVAMETIAKPDYTDPQGYPNDRLGQSLGLKSRFGVSYDYLQSGLLEKAAEILGLDIEQVRLPYVEEWNFAANVFNHLRGKFNESLPDLGTTNSWEWCENAYGSDGHLVAGGRGSGGLSAVGRRWHDSRRDYIGFRVLAVF